MNLSRSSLGKANELGTKNVESKISDQVNSPGKAPEELRVMVIMQVRMWERTRHNWLGLKMVGIYFLYAEIPSWENRN